jgi:glycosyltransferase involved in cell wall biosynthesis
MIHAKGGTEILHENLVHKLGKNDLLGINLILNNFSQELLRSDQINILWNHHSYNQPAIQAYQNKELLKKIQYFVYVSNWQYEKYRYHFQIPENRSLVIKNAIQSIELKEKPNKIRLIFTSTPWRGLDVLLDAFSFLGRDDVELDVYSSTIIYGTQFHEQNEKDFKALFQRAESMKNVNYHGYASNEEIRDALSRAHVFAYPCTWEETSCLSAIEAGMAGLNLVATNLGALYETINSWGRLVSYDSNKMNLARKFSFALNRAIDEYWTQETQQRLQEQHVYYKKFYSWDSRISEWRNFLLQIKQ